MRTRIGNSQFLSDEAVFYAEQWAALAVGAICLATALIAGVHDYGLAGLEHRSTIRELAFFSLNWSPTISSALIGVVLLRFAFRAQSQQKKKPERAHDQTRTKARSVSKLPIVAHAVRTGGGE